MNEPLTSDLEVCRYCEGGMAMNPAECPECEGEVMVRYEKPAEPLTSKKRAHDLAIKILHRLDPRYPDRWYDHIVSVLTPNGNETKATQPPDSRGDTAIWVLAWLAHKGGLGHDAHRVIDAVMENRAVMRSDGTLHIEPRPELKAREAQPNDAFRWVCPTCRTVNDIAATHCEIRTCNTPRPPSQSEGSSL